MAAPIISTNALDAQLNYIKNNTENLYLCSALPSTFAEASSTYKLATKATPSIGALGDSGVDGGREFTVSQISDGTIDASGTATHFALTDDSASELLLADALGVSQYLVSGEEFQLDAFDVEARPSESS